MWVNGPCWPVVHTVRTQIHLLHKLHYAGPGTLRGTHQGNPCTVSCVWSLCHRIQRTAAAMRTLISSVVAVLSRGPGLACMLYKTTVPLGWPVGVDLGTWCDNPCRNHRTEACCARAVVSCRRCMLSYPRPGSAISVLMTCMHDKD